MADETTLMNTTTVTPAATDPVADSSPPATTVPPSPASPQQAKDWLQSIVAYAHREDHDIEQWFHDAWIKVKTAGEKLENEI